MNWFAFAADRRAQFETIEYTEDEYQNELQHIEKVEETICFICLARPVKC